MQSVETEAISAPGPDLLSAFHRYLLPTMAIQTLALKARRPRPSPSVNTHTMGTSLYRYLEIKMHQKIREISWDQIVIVGAYTRTSPSEIFDREKTDKLFNWQRPTARVLGRTLIIQCFPGFDHVEHYAELVATYLQLQEGLGNTKLTSPAKVSFVPASCSETQLALRNTNLTEFPHVDTVVLGLVHRLDRLTGEAEWQGGDGCFGWIVKQMNGRSVAFVGCRPSFWGDISGEIVHYLASKMTLREVIYFGKLGSVKKGIPPNKYLATGTRSQVDGRVVEWPNILENSAKRVASDCLIIGEHVTLGSVIHETKEWLAGLDPSTDFVDPEIGTLAQAAVRSGIGFGYLHIISDNVMEKYSEDLSNEREKTVLVGRTHLYDVVQDVLQHYLSN